MVAERESGGASQSVLVPAYIDPQIRWGMVQGHCTVVRPERTWVFSRAGFHTGGGFVTNPAPSPSHMEPLAGQGSPVTTQTSKHSLSLLIGRCQDGVRRGESDGRHRALLCRTALRHDATLGRLRDPGVLQPVSGISAQ